MKARVLVIEAEDLAVVEKYLRLTDKGVILVTPSAAKQFKEETGHAVPKGELILYDFGGCADVRLDIMRSTDTYATTGLLCHIERVKT